MARFSVGGRDDGEGSGNHQSRKRQRLPSIDEDEEDAEDGSDAGSSGEEDEEYNSLEMIRKQMKDLRWKWEFIESNFCCNWEYCVATGYALFVVLVHEKSIVDEYYLDNCDNGHLACSVCCTKVRNICPSCTLPIGYIRCRAMEKVIEASRVSCPNAKYGCKEKMSYGNRFSHEKLCVFTPCSCPVLNCNYTGYYKDLNSHVGAKHKDDVIPFVWDVSLSISLDHYKKTRFWRLQY